MSDAIAVRHGNATHPITQNPHMLVEGRARKNLVLQHVVEPAQAAQGKFTRLQNPIRTKRRRAARDGSIAGGQRSVPRTCMLAARPSRARGYTSTAPATPAAAL
ncbi:hypothetical protein GCM10027419_43750 [Pandoraea terrae]